eukprot:CAMPEP_0168416062 /NCGR_PEP_ID=MMETSP0228-20121227/30552_1 /TAXON_ID=133427 /ORGANISM="Protoceratium reticulatum, Strain CCCM 535 (=CCMP 1889)" /LENGTH=255 /DNA_ID=CAMNT_0008429887 /DNA_START=147 /DNA_END=910 /DNA_ORIENTATION=+
MVRECLWVAQTHVDGLPVVLSVEHKGCSEGFLVEELDQLRTLEGHLGELAAELVLDHLLHAAEPDPLRVVDQHPEQDQAQVVHVLDLFALGPDPVAVGRGELAEHRLDGLEHLPVVHDEPPVLDRELHDVADLAQRVLRQEGEVALHQLPRHSVAASREGVLTVQELCQLLPHGLVIRVVGGVDVYPAFEPGRLRHEEDRRLIGLAVRRLLHYEEVRVLRVELDEALDDQLRAGPFLEPALHVVRHGLDAVLVER